MGGHHSRDRGKACFRWNAYALPCIWVNFPGRDAVASLKLFQLEVARNLGLAIPETIVTNEPAIAKAFYEKLNGKVIYKLITEKSNFFLPHYEFPHGIPTLPVREMDLHTLNKSGTRHICFNKKSKNGLTSESPLSVRSCLPFTLRARRERANSIGALIIRCR